MAETCDLRFCEPFASHPRGLTAIAAGGLRAKERSSFETGVFGAIEFTGGIRSALWGKAKTQRLEFEKSFLKLSQLCSRR